MAAAGDHHDPQGHRPRPTPRAAEGGGGRILDEAALDGPGPGGGSAGLDAIVGSEPTPAFAALVAEQYSRLLEKFGDQTLRRIALLKMEGYTLDEIAAQSASPGGRWSTSSS